MSTPAPTNTSAIDTFIDFDKAAKDVSIATIGEMVDVNEFNRQPGLVYYYTSAAAKAERQLSKFKLQLEMAEADAKAEATKELKDAGEKITVDAVAQLARKNRVVTKLDALVIQAKDVLDTIKGVCTALNHKKDMLVMRGHMTRDEVKARLSVESSLPDGISSKEARVAELLASRDA